MFGNKILDFKDELLKDLNTLLSFESVDGEKNDECDNALNFILKRAEDFGLTGEKNNRQERSYNPWQQRKALWCAYSP